MFASLLVGSILSVSTWFAGADCCSLNLACCRPASACCESEAQRDCCANAQACCDEAKACCAERSDA
jgi:hypothetical protein